MGLTTTHTLASTDRSLHVRRATFFALTIICMQLAVTTLHAESLTVNMTWNFEVWLHLPASPVLAVDHLLGPGERGSCFMDPISENSENMQVYSCSFDELQWFQWVEFR